MFAMPDARGRTGMSNPQGPDSRRSGGFSSGVDDSTADSSRMARLMRGREATARQAASSPAGSSSYGGGASGMRDRAPQGSAGEWGGGSQDRREFVGGGAYGRGPSRRPKMDNARHQPYSGGMRYDLMSGGAAAGPSMDQFREFRDTPSSHEMRPAPPSGGSPFLSPGNMGGVMDTPGLPGYRPPMGSAAPDSFEQPSAMAEMMRRRGDPRLLQFDDGMSR